MTYDELNSRTCFVLRRDDIQGYRQAQTMWLLSDEWLLGLQSACNDMFTHNVHACLSSDCKTEALAASLRSHWICCLQLVSCSWLTRSCHSATIFRHTAQNRADGALDQGLNVARATPRPRAGARHRARGKTCSSRCRTAPRTARPPAIQVITRPFRRSQSQ